MSKKYYLFKKLASKIECYQLKKLDTHDLEIAKDKAQEEHAKLYESDENIKSAEYLQINGRLIVDYSV